MKKSLDHANPRDGALYLIEHAIPCILHLENRTLLKILQLLLVEGWSNAQRRALIDSQAIRSIAEREDMFIAKVTSLMNTEILGSENNVGQWKMPIEKKLDLMSA